MTTHHTDPTPPPSDCSDGARVARERGRGRWGRGRWGLRLIKVKGIKSLKAFNKVKV